MSKNLTKSEQNMCEICLYLAETANSCFRHKAVKVGTTVPLSHSLYEVHAASRQATTAVHVYHPATRTVLVGVQNTW